MPRRIVHDEDRPAPAPQHNLPSFVAFVDLVKAYDTVNHELLIEVLAQYGAPAKLCSAIERLYADLKVILKIGKEKAEIPQTVGVRQGDNLSPVLFLFFMSAFAESLETDWERLGLAKAQFSRVTAEDIANGKGQLIAHKLTNGAALGSLFEVLQILYVDDGAFIFNSRQDLIRGVNLINAIFKKFGMEMHIGRNGKASKTECIFFPPPGFFDQPELASSVPASPDLLCDNVKRLHKRRVFFLGGPRTT